MNTNRYLSPKAQVAKPQKPSPVGPAWWGLAISAAFAFILAIWLLTRSGA
jgi:hypothetical protein